MSDSESKVLRDYYMEKDFIASPDGILKVLTVVCCIAVGALGLAVGGAGGGACSWAGGVGGGAALGGAGLLAALVALALLGVPQRAPFLWLYTVCFAAWVFYSIDVTVGSVVGAALAVGVLFRAVACSLDAPLDYVYCALGGVSACLSAGGAVVGFAGAMRRVDRAPPPRPHAPPGHHRPAHSPSTPPPADADV